MPTLASALEFLNEHNNNFKDTVYKKEETNVVMAKTFYTLMSQAGIVSMFCFVALLGYEAVPTVTPVPYDGSNPNITGCTCNNALTVQNLTSLNIEENPVCTQSTVVGCYTALPTVASCSYGGVVARTNPYNFAGGLEQISAIIKNTSGCAQPVLASDGSITTPSCLPDFVENVACYVLLPAAGGIPSCSNLLQYQCFASYLGIYGIKYRIQSQALPQQLLSAQAYSNFVANLNFDISSSSLAYPAVGAFEKACIDAAVCVMVYAKFNISELPPLVDGLGSSLHSLAISPVDYNEYVNLCQPSGCTTTLISTPGWHEYYQRLGGIWSTTHSVISTLFSLAVPAWLWWWFPLSKQKESDEQEQKNNEAEISLRTLPIIASNQPGFLNSYSPPRRFSVATIAQNMQQPNNSNNSVSNNNSNNSVSNSNIIINSSRSGRTVRGGAALATIGNNNREGGGGGIGVLSSNEMGRGESRSSVAVVM